MKILNPSAAFYPHKNVRVLCVCVLWEPTQKPVSSQMRTTSIAFNPYACIQFVSDLRVCMCVEYSSEHFFCSFFSIGIIYLNLWKYDVNVSPRWFIISAIGFSHCMNMGRHCKTVKQTPQTHGAHLWTAMRVPSSKVPFVSISILATQLTRNVTVYAHMLALRVRNSTENRRQIISVCNSESKWKCQSQFTNTQRTSTFDIPKFTIINLIRWTFVLNSLKCIATEYGLNLKSMMRMHLWSPTTTKAKQSLKQKSCGFQPDRRKISAFEFGPASEWTITQVKLKNVSILNALWICKILLMAIFHHQRNK